MDYVKGNTYPVRDQMRKLGGQWDVEARAWVFESVTVANQARAIVASAPKPAGRYHNRARASNVFRFPSGATVYRNPRGRCEDAPCCGCCT